MDLHGKRLLCLNKAMRSLAHLPAMLGCQIDFQVKGSPKAYDGVVVWGKKRSAKRGEVFASKYQLPVIRFEDGFLRSVGLGPDDPPLSICIDDLGIYYDASTPSRLERLIAQPLSEENKDRTRKLIQAWRDARVSKYNQGREWGAQNLVNSGPYVLLIDQTYGDASIEYGAADAASFVQALEDAIKDYPEHRVIVKTHPDVIAGRKRGHFSAVPEHLQGRFELLGDPIHVPALLEHATAVYCITSQVGFEALLWNKPVHVYGMPFYAGWGLTTDAQAAPPRRAGREVTLEQLVFAALIMYPRYSHPETKECCEVEDVLHWMALQRQMIERFPPQLEARRWSRWKRQIIRSFLQGSQVFFVRELSGSLPTVGWGARAQADIRVEDGFIRSVGLGADLTKPQSWVVDDLGMYYDATKPSRLEEIYKSHIFDEPIIDRAKALIETLVRLQVTKYNVGRKDWRRPTNIATGAQVILVPGQVETDASIQLGSPVIHTNIELLRTVREVNPNAYIVYKPHPDVQAGLRLAGDEEQAAMFYDELVLDQDMAWLLTQVDAVHTMTSLTGFEALIRGLQVACYGQPFYAGWGLTTDVHPCPRRGRLLSVEALVAGALILYPTYLSRASGKFCQVERVVTEIATTRKSAVKAWGLTRVRRLLLRAWRF